MSLFKKSIAVILCLLVLIPTATVIGSAAVFESKEVASATSSNVLDINTGRWASTSTSYIYENDGNIVLVRADSKITATTYSSNYQKLSEININAELPLFGGFCSGETFNYIVFGQNNTEESETKEVYRIVKYDKNFNKISHASITGEQSHTVTPFSHGSTSMAEYGNQLTIHTSRKRFTSDDGLNHQSQFTIVLDTTTMTPVNTLSLFQANHVSHSFNQFAQYDGETRVLVDHGDAYPRSVVLSKFKGYSKYGTEQYTEINLFDIPGDIGANCTGVNIGGFEVSENNYIVSINTIDHSKVTSYTHYEITGISVDARDAVLLISAKNNTSTSNVKKVYLTNFANNNKHATAPYLVKLTDKWFAAIWNEYKVTQSKSGNYVYYEYENIGIKYVIVDENGNKLTDIKTASVTARLSDCQPMFLSNKIIWSYDSDSKRQICALDISDDLKEITHTHSLVKVEAKTSTCTAYGNKEYFKCEDCGNCYKDSKGTTATTVSDEKLPLAEHQGGNATCTAKANCSVCNTPYGSTIPHTPGEWTEVAKPDCKNAGTKVRLCTVCNQTAETGTIPAKGHTPGEWIVSLEPTTTSNGKKIQLCTVCRNIVDEQIIPMTGMLNITDSTTGIEIMYPENSYEGTVGITSSFNKSDELIEILRAYIGNCKYAGYNIALTVDGVQDSSGKTFTAKIPAPLGINKDYATVYYVNPVTNIPQQIKATYINGYYCIENAASGLFIIVEKNATLSLSVNSASMKPGEAFQLIADSGSRPVSFTSSNPSVATVDDNGNIKAVSNGTAIITVTVADSDVSATCTITVNQSFFEMIISAIINAFSGIFSLLSELLGMF